MPNPFICPKCGFDCELAPRHNCVDDNDEKLLKYKYGVEYPTNGKKPDLPDDVLVEFYDLCLGVKPVGVLAFNRFKSFRIVDERYKPAGPVSGAGGISAKEAINNIINAMKSTLPSGWYERGELPPVGVECEVSAWGNSYEWCKINYMGKQRCIVEHKTQKEQHYHLTSVKFRPTKTEREKFVEAAHAAIGCAGFDEDETNSDYFEALFDAGFKAPE